MNSTNDRSLHATVCNVLAEYAQMNSEARLYELSHSLRNDLGIESLSLVSVVLRLGDEFGVDIVDSALDLGSLKTVGDLVALARTLTATTTLHREGAPAALHS